MTRAMQWCRGAALSLALGSSLGAQAAGLATEATDRFIVGFRSEAGDPSARAGQLAQGRYALTLRRSIAGRMHVLQAPRELAGAELQSALAQLRADPAVAWVQPDRRKRALALPNDPLLGEQWWLRKPAASTQLPVAGQGQPASINAESAWDISTGSARIVVAVVDTGVLFDHPDLGRSAAGGRVLPGYDFISQSVVANDGDGRDPDASDSGDWVSVQDTRDYPSLFRTDCLPEAGVDSASTWHGTHVAGIIGAAGNNSQGMAGVGWGHWILPVRALGKCGGFDSDILAAMAWSVGLTVANGTPLPANPTPARVVNLSLGSNGACSPAYRDLIAQMRARGATVFAAGGNDSGPVGEPANCPGVVAVAGVRHSATKVGYSAHGPEVGIAAPAGNCGQLSGPCLFPILSTSNSGQTVAVAMEYRGKLGTSFATPMAAGVAALMLAVNPQLPPARLESRLKASARAFPAADSSLLACSSSAFRPDAQGNWPNDGQCNCDAASCGAGLLDAGAAVSAAQAPIAAIAATTPTVGLAAVSLDASASVAIPGASISSYSWAIVSASSPGASLSATSGAQVRLLAAAPGFYSVELQVQDSAGRVGVAGCTLNVTPSGTSSACGDAMPLPIPALVSGAATTLPPMVSNGGGGGGLAWEGLLALFLLAAWRLAPRRR